MRQASLGRVGALLRRPRVTWIAGVILPGIWLLLDGIVELVWGWGLVFLFNQPGSSHGFVRHLGDAVYVTLLFFIGVLAAWRLRRCRPGLAAGVLTLASGIGVLLLPLSALFLFWVLVFVLGEPVSEKMEPEAPWLLGILLLFLLAHCSATPVFCVAALDAGRSADHRPRNLALGMALILFAILPAVAFWLVLFESP